MKKFVLASLIVGMGVMSLGCGEKTDPKAGTYNPQNADPTKVSMPALGGAPAAGGAAPAGGAPAGGAAPAGS